jgi:hypothetical protein
MRKVRVRVPVTLDLPDSTVALLEAAAPFVRAIREHAPALRQLGATGSAFAREANRIVKEQRRKGPAVGKKRRA